MTTNGQTMHAPRDGAPMTEQTWSMDLEAALTESYTLNGDTSRLTDAERQTHYTALCRALHLNPLTQPFQWLKLNGKLVLYITRTATDQLSAMHGLNRETVRGPRSWTSAASRCCSARCA